jgi:tRNA(Ile)-lysidine synthetase-like protein
VPRARPVVQRALRAVATRLPDLLSPGGLVLVGYSGGQDSTCLLHALSLLRPAPRVLAVHVDHALRAESATDALRVQALAQSMGVECQVTRVDVAAYRAAHGGSVQAAARAARYHALAGAVEAHQARGLLVAHTADDQAETVLLNLARGASLAGLAGMRLDEVLETRQLGPLPTGLRPSGPLRVARPLLRVPRTITGSYCAELGVSLVEDTSNQSRAYTRNRVRLDLLPALERFNPAIRTVLARLADVAAEEIDLVEAMVAELHTRLALDALPGVVRYELGAFRQQPRALQRRLVRHALRLLLGHLVDVPAAPIDDALDLLSSGRPGQAYHLPYGVELCVDHASFSLHRQGRAMQRQPRRGPNTRGPAQTRV